MKNPKTVKFTKRVISMTEGDKTKALRRIVIKPYPDPQNPRTEWDNVFRIYSECRYLSSDKGAFNPVVDYGKKPDEAKYHDGVCAFPIYMYVHSGATVSLKPFSCPWDSGCAGWIYVNKADFCKEYGLKRFSRTRAYKIAEGEIACLDMFLNDRVFGYVEQTRETPEDEWEDGDSCWGYFGDSARDIGSMLSDAGGYEKGTIICEDDDAYCNVSEVTMEIAVRDEQKEEA